MASTLQGVYRQAVESSLLALFHPAAVFTLPAVSRQAVEPTLLESYPQAPVSLIRLTHLVPAAQALVVTIPPGLVVHRALAPGTIPPVLAVHLALALVSTHPALVAHPALAPESTHPVLAPSLPSFPHLVALSQAGSTQPVPAFQQSLRGAVSDSKRDNCEGCIDGRNAFTMRELDRNRRLPAQGHGNILTTPGVFWAFLFFFLTFHTKSPVNRQA